MRAVIVLSALLLATGAQAWWCTGHMIIGEIARQNLETGVEDKVNTVMQFLSDKGGFSQSPDMVNGACWADDLKSQGLTAMAGWHFINQPYIPDGFVPPVTPQIQNDNVANNINSLDDTMQKRDINIWIKAFATANLIHFIGDVHQPLHATELYSTDFPTGDAGGTRFHVQFQGVQWKLHFIWDSVCGQYQQELSRPLDATNMATIKSLAQQYQANFSVPEAMKKVWNGTTMAAESYAAAVSYAYDHHSFRPGATINSTYIAACEVVAGYRIAYAGYRLAHELNYLFKDHRTDEEFMDRIKVLQRN